MSDNLPSPSAATLARIARSTTSGQCLVCGAEPDWQCDEVVHKQKNSPTYGHASLPVVGYKPPKSRKSRILEFFKDIEQGNITLTSDTEPQFVFAGNVEYTASNGWKVVIYNDCNEWDYIDSIHDEKGLLGEYTPSSPSIFDLSEVRYKPPKSLWWKLYGLPGWCKTRNPMWFGNRNRDPDIRVIPTMSYGFTVKRVGKWYWVTSLGVSQQDNIRLLWKLNQQSLTAIRACAEVVNADDYLNASAPGFKEWREEEQNKLMRGILNSMSTPQVVPQAD